MKIVYQKTCVIWIALLILFLNVGALEAHVRLPGFYGDHMVLQQQTKLKIWGWSDPGEEITVSIGENSATGTADELGKWIVELAPMKASKTAHKMIVQGHNSVELNDILIGEVWLCSGQSNMEWTVRASANSAEEIAAADFPMIRHIKVPRVPSAVAKDDIKSTWQICSPETAANFTACGYFMARKLYKELDVPIGLVNSSWGGTRVEPWTPPIGFERVDALKSIFDSVVGRTPGHPVYTQKLSDHINATEDWLAKAKAAVDSKESIGASPAFPADMVPFTKHQDPTMLYNGMIHALVGFPIRGAIWYQGESNHQEGMLYFEKKKALINGWRELWKQGDFPFYFVQIAPFQYGNEDPTILAEFWEAQAAVTELPNTGMVVINDIATLNDIHPPNKQDVGMRLANLALKNDYGKSDVVANSPQFESMEVDGQKLMVKFSGTGGGLKTRDGKAPTDFEIIGAGSDGFQAATATVAGDSVTLSSEKVEKPTAFRFAWNKMAEPNLCGGTGLPVGAVRGGEVPKFLDTIPIGTEYQLVYQMDLAKLKAEPEYEVNNSAKIKSFDRIGYLVELNSTEFGDQKVFVTMNAFTDDVGKIGIPTVASKAHFQTKLEGMEVFSNVKGIVTGEISNGNIEFWPNNYSPQNSGKVKGASAQNYDFGDQPVPPVAGHGCMQIHNFGARQTLFAINNWRWPENAGIGIGNQKSGQPDWTFSKAAGKYQSKMLRVYVRSKN